MDNCGESATNFENEHKPVLRAVKRTHPTVRFVPDADVLEFSVRPLSCGIRDRSSISASSCNIWSRRSPSPCRYARAWVVHNAFNGFHVDSGKNRDSEIQRPLSILPCSSGSLRRAAGRANSCADNAVAVPLPGIYWLGKIRRPPTRSRGIAQMSRNRSSSLLIQSRNGRTMYHRRGQ
jgi:hypothetical protein